jgi:hypothetical protein
MLLVSMMTITVTGPSRVQYNFSID